MPIIDARRQAVKQLQQTVQRARVNFTQPQQTSTNNNTTTSTTTTTSSTTAVNEGPLTDVNSVGSLAVDIRNRRALAALLQASV